MDRLKNNARILSLPTVLKECSRRCIQRKVTLTLTNPKTSSGSNFYANPNLTLTLTLDYNNNNVV
jgi:hypothetical protein